MLTETMKKYQVVLRTWENGLGIMDDKAWADTESEVTKVLNRLNDPYNTWVNEWGGDGKISKQTFGYVWLKRIELDEK